MKKKKYKRLVLEVLKAGAHAHWLHASGAIDIETAGQWFAEELVLRCGSKNLAALCHVAAGTMAVEG